MSPRGPSVLPLSNRSGPFTLGSRRGSNSLPRIHMYLEPRDVNLRGSRVYADVTKYDEVVLDSGEPNPMPRAP